MKRAVLLTRPGAQYAPGGDTLQIHESADVLRSQGWQAQIVDSANAALEALREGDTLHLWNIQRVWDWGELVQQARRRGARVLITPLLHPLGLYHRRGRAGLDRLAAKFIRDPDRFAALRWGRGNLRAEAKTALDAADVVLLAHKQELAWLQDWCEAQPRCTAVVPPAIPAVQTVSTATALPQDFILSVGRIEPLKNPMAVRKAAARLRRDSIFVGGVPRGQHLLYSRAFRRSTRRAGTRWLGPLPAAQVRAVMRHARVHALASWTEVLGRVSVEAALEGCAVVATNVGHLPALLGRETPGLFLVEPGDDEGLLKAIQEAWSFGRSPGGPLSLRAESLTWERVAPQLLDAYEAS